MTAKEMFKELGFKRKKYNGYIDYKDILTWDEVIVSFNIKNKTFEVYCENYDYSMTTRSAAVGTTLNQAIQQQIKELGWNEVE